MGLIGEGKNKVNELVDTLNWTRDRVEETIDDLRDSDYVKQVQQGGEEVLEITDRGREHLPKLVEEVADDTRDFLESVSSSFQKHFDQVFPKVDIDIRIKKPKDEE